MWTYVRWLEPDKDKGKVGKVRTAKIVREENDDTTVMRVPWGKQKTLYKIDIISEENYNRVVRQAQKRKSFTIGDLPHKSWRRALEKAVDHVEGSVRQIVKDSTAGVIGDGRFSTNIPALKCQVKSMGERLEGGHRLTYDGLTKLGKQMTTESRSILANLEKQRDTGNARLQNAVFGRIKQLEDRLGAQTKTLNPVVFMADNKTDIILANDARFTMPLTTYQEALRACSNKDAASLAVYLLRKLLTPEELGRMFLDQEEMKKSGREDSKLVDQAMLEAVKLQVVTQRKESIDEERMKKKFRRVICTYRQETFVELGRGTMGDS